MSSLVIVLSLAAQIPAPESTGPLAVTIASDVSVMAGGQAVNVDVFSPSDRAGAPFPVVIAGHGFARNNDNVAGHAAHLASWGMVVVTPDFPSRFSPDHALNGRIMRDLLTWARGGPAPIGPIVDAQRSAYVGHSAGGLAAFLAAAADPSVTALVGLDPVDAGGVGARAAPMIGARTLVTSAEPSRCNATASADALYAALGAPDRWYLRVASATHCDAEDPSNGLCTATCGGEDATRRARFRRYMTAHLRAVFACDALAWVPGGAGLAADTALTGVASVGTHGCAPGVDAGMGPPLPRDAEVTDAVSPPADAGVVSSDTGIIPPDSGNTPADAAPADDLGAPLADAADQPADAATIPAGDATAGDARAPVGLRPSPDPSCGCHSVGPGELAPLLALLACAALLRRRAR